MTMNEQHCIIISSTVTGICSTTAPPKMCMAMADVTIAPVPNNHTSITGTIKTTNIIMANWPKSMWQNVVNRAVRTLALAPFGSHFFSATGTVSGN
ncbi:hypothetical protein KIN20_026813 [Parelaphostrongylus tenuis]|uniref:Uncharacterized protein n=1 Tax=Parelaphostrongylus tenuis TaxID=148309 RepID=A0AAD5QYK3_PARTN|nr:hypothetical protein KIN20_026813 [Parelaphostrongylus tenuis]